MKRNLGIFILLTFLLSGGLTTMIDARRQAAVRAPELNGGVSWLNTDKPLSLAALKGKVVLLDFWTYGCINCINIIPDLKKLEAKYQNELVVIGVHSAKFDNEKDTENIRKIILRYGIEHPIVNDANFKIWEQYAVNAYPTRILIDPNGYIAGTYVGEGDFDAISEKIAAVAAEAKKKGQLNEQPLKLVLEKAKVGDLPLAFPGKVLADAKSNRLFIADSNHNRIVIADLNGKLIDTIGSGKAARIDGDYSQAAFNRPQGLALDGDNLYVADTENHSIRLVDLKTKKVSSVAGTGSLNDFTGYGGNEPLKVGLRSPWDLTLVGKILYIAMAGSHQIWRMDLEKNRIEPYAGTRAEARYDDLIGKAAFAQPSGIASDGKNLFVADSESNVIRQIDLQQETVETLVGGDLYVFGDADGTGDDVRLQHPLGVVLYNGKVLIADTYNHKIKLLDAATQTVSTFLGTGESGQIDGKNATFYEPAGLSIAGDKLYIADTNNQAIRVVDLPTKTVSTLKIEGLKPPLSDAANDKSYTPNAKQIEVEKRQIAVGANNQIVFNIALPDGYHLNADAPQKYEISAENNQNIKIAQPAQRFKMLPVVIPFQTLKTGAANLKAKLSIYYCREDNTGVCRIKTLVFNVPLEVIADKKAAKKVEVSAVIE